MMKKKVIVVALLLSCMTLWADDGKRSLEVKDLPHLALSNLTQYFPDVEVTEAYTGTQKIKDEYTVVLANSVKVVFDKHGQWKEVQANDGEIPVRMIHGKIQMHLAQKGIAAKVVRMKKDKKGNYEITLSDGNELCYDSQLKPITKKQ